MDRHWRVIQEPLVTISFGSHPHPKNSMNSQYSRLPRMPPPPPPPSRRKKTNKIQNVHHPWDTDFYTPPVLGGAALFDNSAAAVYKNPVPQHLRRIKINLPTQTLQPPTMDSVCLQKTRFHANPAPGTEPCKW